MSNSIDGLMPCPFCGGPPINVAGEYITCGAGWNGQCPGHGVKAAPKLWNTRTPAPSLGEDVVGNLDAFDAGLLGDGGGGDIAWWQDYIRSLLGQADEHYREQVAALTAMTPVQEEGLGEKLAALREEVDRFRRPSARNLSTSDPITPLPTFQPRHLLGLALLFREWCHSDLWGRPNEAELAARQVETAYHIITSHPEASPPSLGVEELPEIEAEGERLAAETHKHSSGMYLWTDLVGAIQTAIAEERARHAL
jgi:hypothetical protein